MPISPEHLDKLIHIYKKNTGQDITRDEAEVIRSRLVRLYQLMFEKRPMPPLFDDRLRGIDRSP